MSDSGLLSGMLQEEEVAEYLGRHPEFFLRHKVLLDNLQIPHQVKGAVSLFELQQERQRERISELEQMLKNVKVIDESELSVDVVSVGTHVTIQEEGSADSDEYDIVGRTEANPLAGKISDESPVGSALLGKHVGDEADVTLPSGHTVAYKVLNISHSK